MFLWPVLKQLKDAAFALSSGALNNEVCDLKIWGF